MMEDSSEGVMEAEESMNEVNISDKFVQDKKKENWLMKSFDSSFVRNPRKRRTINDELLNFDLKRVKKTTPF